MAYQGNAGFIIYWLSFGTALQLIEVFVTAPQIVVVVVPIIDMQNLTRASVLNNILDHRHVGLYDPQ